MNERIKELRKALGLTLEKFGARLGVTKTAISQIENGKNNLTDQMFLSICREFNVNEDWLRNGTGEMFVIIPEEEEVIYYTQALLETQNDPVSDLIKDLIVIYMKLEPSDQAVLQNVAEDLLEKMAARKKEQP